MRRTLSCFVVCLLACLAPGAGAQERRPAENPRPSGEGARPSGEEGRPNDLSITARVTAESLVFRKVPNPRVEFTGRPRRETVWEAERTNLPEEVRPGVTYRDVGITLRITSVFADIERIVAEALGEVPASDEPAPEGPRRDDPPSPPAPAAPAAPPAQAGPEVRNVPGEAPRPLTRIETSRSDAARARGARAARRAASRQGRGQ